MKEAKLVNVLAAVVVVVVEEEVEGGGEGCGEGGGVVMVEVEEEVFEESCERRASELWKGIPLLSAMYEEYWQAVT